MSVARPSSPVPSGPLAGFDRVIQVGIVVDDIDRTIRGLADLFGIGPFRVVECPAAGREDRQFLRGESAAFKTRQAFADLGSIELELIQPLEGRSIWSEFLAERGPGIHHIRFNVPDHASLTKRLADRGIGTTQEGAGIRDGSYWINYDTTAILGFIVEILQPAPGSDGRTPGTRPTPSGEATA
jgi:hypothetical protein